MQTDKRFCGAGGKQTRFPGGSRKVPSNTAAAAAGAALQGRLKPGVTGGPALPTAPQCPHAYSPHQSCSWQGRAHSPGTGGEGRKGLGRVDLENLSELQMARQGPAETLQTTPTWGGCRAGGRRGWKGRKKAADSQGERERVSIQLGLAEIWVVPSAGAEVPPRAGAPRCPQVRALTWITSEGLVQTAAAKRSVGEVTRPWAGRGVAREGPAPP